MSAEPDIRYMTRALALAERGMYTTTPNPRVGCVLVRDGEVVGEGWHERAGAPHAEALALRAAGARAEGATAYVTLEPCSHHGRTPPCSEALIRARVGRVVAAMRDPNPLVAGKGLLALRAAGIAIECGFMEKEAHALNPGFVSRMVRGRPWIRVKVAASLDGKTALLNGRSQWITGAEARRDGHRWRARACAVMTGIGTVRSDDPLLNVRDVQTARQPMTIVVDSRLEIPTTARVLREGSIVAAAARDAAREQALRARGAEVIALDDGAGAVDLHALVRELARRSLNEIHVEAGSRLHSALWRAGLVDELLVYVAPRILGEAAKGMFDFPELTDLAQARTLELSDVRVLDGDIRIVAQVRS